MKQFPRHLPLILAALVCITSLTVMLLVLVKPQPEFSPPPFDEHAVSGIPDVPEDLDWMPVETPNYVVSLCGRVIAEDTAADVWLYNSEENVVWLKLRVLDESGKLLGETGLLKPGEYVRSVSLTTPLAPGTPITLKLMSYTPETYHSEGTAILRTQISE